MSQSSHLTGAQREQLRIDFAAYIERTEIPVAAEFAAKRGIARERLYDLVGFRELTRLCVEKKEAALERAMYEGRVNISAAIFALKQLGWKDRVEHSGDPNAPVALILQGSDVHG